MVFAIALFTDLARIAGMRHRCVRGSGMQESGAQTKTPSRGGRGARGFGQTLQRSATFTEKRSRDENEKAGRQHLGSSGSEFFEKTPRSYRACIDGGFDREHARRWFGEYVRVNACRYGDHAASNGCDK